jgi:hypothetical protein
MCIIFYVFANTNYLWLVFSDETMRLEVKRLLEEKERWSSTLQSVEDKLSTTEKVVVLLQLAFCSHKTLHQNHQIKNDLEQRVIKLQTVATEFDNFKEDLALMGSENTRLQDENLVTLLLAHVDACK